MRCLERQITSVQPATPIALALVVGGIIGYLTSEKLSGDERVVALTEEVKAVALLTAQVNALEAQMTVGGGPQTAISRTRGCASAGDTARPAATARTVSGAQPYESFKQHVKREAARVGS